MKRLKLNIPKLNLIDLKTHQYLTILGGSILFLSWIVERNIKQNWTDAKENHLQSLINSSFRQVQRLTAETTYYDAIKKEEIDSGQVAFSQAAIMDIYLGLLDAYYIKKEENLSDYKNFKANERRIIGENKQLIRNGQYHKINESYNGVEDVFRKNFGPMRKKHQNHLNEIIRSEAKWNNIFILLYVIGSLLLGLGYLKNATDNAKNQLNNTKIPQSN